jgi:hypothetical protein
MRTKLEDPQDLATSVMKPTIEKKSLQWEGWFGFRRALVSHLYALGVAPKVISGDEAGQGNSQHRP